MEIETIRTGWTLVSSAVPDRSTHRFPLAYTGLFQRRSKRIKVPVKCFSVAVGGHRLLIDTGWSLQVTEHPLRHLGFGLWFASEPVMEPEEAAVRQLKGRPIDAILMTHLDCDHVSGLHDFPTYTAYTSAAELEYSRKNKIRYGNLAKGRAYKLIDFAEDAAAPFDLSADLFGDGSVTALLTPTHSAGSIIYKITEGNAFALVVGDNGYSQDSWEKGLLPGPLYNAENMRKCLAWIKAQAADDRCVGIYCAHDPIDR